MGLCNTVGLSQDLDEWCRDQVNNAYSSDFSGINVIEKILRDPGMSTDGSRDRVLYWPRSKRIARISRAMHQVDSISRVCLIVDSGHLMKEDGNSFTLNDLKKNSSLSVGDMRYRIKESKRKLREVRRQSENM